VFLGLHFPSDVVVAAVLGAMVSVIVERGVSRPLGLAASGALVARRRAKMRLRRASLNTD